MATSVATTMIAPTADLATVPSTLPQKAAWPILMLSSKSRPFHCSPRTAPAKAPTPARSTAPTRGADDWDGEADEKACDSADDGADEGQHGPAFASAGFGHAQGAGEEFEQFADDSKDQQDEDRCPSDGDGRLGGQQKQIADGCGEHDPIAGHAEQGEYPADKEDQ